MATAVAAAAKAQEGGPVPSEPAVLRAEIARLHGENASLRALFVSFFDTARGAIESQVRIAEYERRRANSLQKTVSNFETQMHIEASWNGRPSESREYAKTRSEFNVEAARYEAEKRGEDPDEAVPTKGVGGQEGHEGVSRAGVPTETVRFVTEMCMCCGRTDLLKDKIIRKRVFGGGDKTEEGEECLMYVIYTAKCRECRIVTEPHTDVPRGTAFKPHVRGAIRTYHAGGSSVITSQGYLGDLHNTTISAGAVSHCTTAMADEVDDGVLVVPHGTPVIIDDGDLRIHRSPVMPRSIDWDADGISAYGRNDALLTRCSTVWTSYVAQPQMPGIIEVASMEPHAGTDESPIRVKKDGAQVLLARTRRTTQIKVVEHKYVHTVAEFLDWAKDRLLIHDGAQLYRWHDADEERCDVHILRASEDYAMKAGLGSEEYIRHTILRETYHDAKETAVIITEMAGGPITSACDLDIVKRAGLSEFVEAQIARLADRVDMAAAMISDGLATTLRNARDCMFTALRYPGAPLHNNGAEQEILRNVIAGGRKKGPFPNWKAARNFSVQKTFAATCKKNGISAYQATMRMARDPGWGIFTDGVPPPIRTAGAAA